MNWIDEKVKSFADYIENPAVEHHWDKTLDWLRKALAEAHDKGAEEERKRMLEYIEKNAVVANTTLIMPDDLIAFITNKTV